MDTNTFHTLRTGDLLLRHAQLEGITHSAEASNQGLLFCPEDMKLSTCDSLNLATDKAPLTSLIDTAARFSMRTPNLSQNGSLKTRVLNGITYLRHYRQNRRALTLAKCAADSPLSLSLEHYGKQLHALAQSLYYFQNLSLEPVDNNLLGELSYFDHADISEDILKSCLGEFVERVDEVFRATHQAINAPSASAPPKIPTATRYYLQTQAPLRFEQAASHAKRVQVLDKVLQHLDKIEGMIAHVSSTTASQPTDHADSLRALANPSDPTNSELMQQQNMIRLLRRVLVAKEFIAGNRSLVFYADIKKTQNLLQIINQEHQRYSSFRRPDTTNLLVLEMLIALKLGAPAQDPDQPEAERIYLLPDEIETLNTLTISAIEQLGKQSLWENKA